VTGSGLKGPRRRARTLLLLVTMAAIVAVVAAWPAGAAPPQPSAGVANVDGNPGEWNLAADFFADLRLGSNATNPVLAKLYLRYDCTERTLYALVLAEQGVRLRTADPGEAYIAVDGKKIFHGSSGDDGTPPDFRWVDEAGGTAGGYEGSGEVLPGTHQLRAHAKVPATDPDGYETIDIAGRTVPLVVACGSIAPPGGGNPPPPPPPPGPGVTTSPAIDVEIAKRVAPARIPVNDQAVFTLTVRNASGVTATGVTVTDNLPDRVAPVSVTPSRGTCSGSRPIVCQLGTMAPGDIVTITIVVVGAVPGRALNVAVVSANEQETNLANNRAEAELEIHAPTGQNLPCYFLSAKAKVLAPGKTTAIRVTVRLAGKRVGGVKIVARGAGVLAQGRSNANGVAHLNARPTHPGVVRISAVPVRPPGSTPRAGERCGLALGLGVAGVTAEKRLTG
jgi:uncharacterized repeat protein (TIGR01451 family)